MPKVPYLYEVNWHLVTGKGSLTPTLTPICSVSKHSLSPSLTASYFQDEGKKCIMYSTFVSTFLHFMLIRFIIHQLLCKSQAELYAFELHILQQFTSSSVEVITQEKIIDKSLCNKYSFHIQFASIMTKSILSLYSVQQVRMNQN